ncbi:MAG: 50S ribosomal protein L25 [Candidatus Delongbacteria bacterium]|nr:50S ribosomal protein L25 [Candidatus Delongbacteria bacterium]
MLEKITAQPKGNDNKRAIHAKRKAGLVPVNLYGPGIEKSHSYYMDELSLNRAVKSGKKIHEITTDMGDFKVVFKEIQRHPVTWGLTHVDLLSLAPGMKVTLKVPVRYHGVPYGVKNMGGVFIINSRDLEIEALAEYIPNEINVDITDMKLKDTIHASDIVRENIRVVSPSGMLLARVGITRAAVSAGGGADAGAAEGEETAGESSEETAAGEENKESE